VTYLARLNDRVDLAASAPLPKPLALYIEPTNICNFHCDFCAQAFPDYFGRAGYKQHMPMDLYRKVIDDAKAIGGIKTVNLYFLGEPTIHPEIVEMARMAGDISDDVTITTNGTKLTLEKSIGLIEVELDFLRVSIYAETPETTQRLIRSNISSLRIARDTQLAAKPRIIVKWCDPTIGEQVRKDYEGIADEFIYQGLHSMGSDFVLLQPLTGTKKACQHPFYTLLVKANGDVACCCVAWDQTLNVGNVAHESLLEIWEGEALARIQRIHLEGRRKELSTCSNCDTLYSNPDSVDALTVEEFDRRREEWK